MSAESPSNIIDRALETLSLAKEYSASMVLNTSFPQSIRESAIKVVGHIEMLLYTIAIETALSDRVKEEEKEEEIESEEDPFSGILQ